MTSAWCKLLNRRTVWNFFQQKCQYQTHASASHLSSQEVATALRPFYFAVHPDLFGKHPKEREINENSLKLLNSYLESCTSRQSNHATQTEPLTFFLRDTNESGEKPKEQVISVKNSFKKVRIRLQTRDLRSAIHGILSTCQLSTDYLDKLSKSNGRTQNFSQTARSRTTPPPPPRSDWGKGQAVRDAEEMMRKYPELDLKSFINSNISIARAKGQACKPIHEEVKKMSSELKERLQLQDIYWDCGWGISHFRGCLQTFRMLAEQHPREMNLIRGRTLVFGRQTGVSLDGHVILSSGDVKHNWIDLICSVESFDPYLAQVPEAELSLSEVLLGMKVRHRKFKPSVMVQRYLKQLSKMTSALYKYRWQYGYPKLWPRRLEAFELVVESEAGPLMLSPTGQFIAPASCPAFLLVDYITRNLDEATTFLDQYSRVKVKEKELCKDCISSLGLTALEKDDNITPELMVQCCNDLLVDASIWRNYFMDCKLRVSQYYLVSEDGEVYIPWNWAKRMKQSS